MKALKRGNCSKVPFLLAAIFVREDFNGLYFARALISRGRYRQPGSSLVAAYTWRSRSKYDATGVATRSEGVSRVNAGGDSSI